MQVLTHEGRRPYKADELIRRARCTVSRDETERQAWSDELARASVIAPLPEAQRKAMQATQASTSRPMTQASQTKAVPPVATGAPWRRPRQAGEAYDETLSDDLHFANIAKAGVTLQPNQSEHELFLSQTTEGEIGP